VARAAGRPGVPAHRSPRFGVPVALATALERAWSGWRGPHRTEGNADHRFVMDYPVQRHWRWKIAFYMYLSGASAGLVFFEVLLRWAGAIDAETATLGMTLGVVLSLIAILSVFDQLGPVARWNFAFALRRPRTSVVTRSVMGILLLIALRVIAVAPELAGFESPWAEGTATGDVLRALILAVAIVYIVLSAMILSSWNAIPFWNTPMVPALFVGFSLLGGVTTLPMLTWALEGQAAMETLATDLAPVAGALLIANAGLLLLHVQGMSTATRPARVSVRMLLHGAVRGRFLGGVVVLGLAVPALLVSLQLAGSMTGLEAPTALALAVAVQVGGYLLRDAILRVGVYGSPV